MRYGNRQVVEYLKVGDFPLKRSLIGFGHWLGIGLVVIPFLRRFVERLIIFIQFFFQRLWLLGDELFL